ncbi:MAG: helix-turn-helix transcriptional regulator [Dissulfurispiraceae bacterium]
MKEWTPEQIKDFRTRLNLTQRVFASILRVTREYVIYLEKGVRTPSDIMKALLDCLETQGKKTGVKRK